VWLHQSPPQIGGIPWLMGGKMSFSRWFGLAGDVKRVQDHAAGHGGQCTYRFSQSLEPVRSWIKWDERTKNGVCRTLVARWFVEMLKDTPAFWSSALDQRGRPNGAFFGTIMVQQLNPGRVHVAPQGEARDADEGDADMFEPMRAQGCVTIGDEIEMASTEPVQGLAKYMKNAASVVAKHNKTQFCIFLGIGRRGVSGGHTIGAMPTAAGDVRLLDPNVGEFRFPDTDTLSDWMTKDLARLYRNGKYDKWFVHVFGKSS
jgi:hypothetical protein